MEIRQRSPLHCLPGTVDRSRHAVDGVRAEWGSAVGTVQRSIEAFLLNEWRTGALTGNKPEMAFFVRCDRSTMTQNDFDNGRLICLIGVAPVRPAEFVILRIGLWTADRKC